MFSHVMVGANDLEASRKFYDAVFGALGIAPGVINRDIRYFYRTPTGVFAFTLPIDNQAATPANGGTIGFAAKLYLAYLRDPIGNKICAMFRVPK